MKRVCRYCGKEKSHSSFVRNWRCKFGITHKCKDCFNAKSREDYLVNQESVKRRNKKSILKRRAEGKDVNKPSRVYAKKNPHYKRFYAAQRKAYVKLATPKWLTKEQKKDMKAMYDLRSKYETLFGVKYHVDHIVPLRGDAVCGLNVPWNLQLLEANVNMAKRNSYS